MQLATSHLSTDASFIALLPPGTAPSTPGAGLTPDARAAFPQFDSFLPGGVAASAAMATEVATELAGGAALPCAASVAAGVSISARGADAGEFLDEPVDSTRINNEKPTPRLSPRPARLSGALQRSLVPAFEGAQECGRGHGIDALPPAAESPVSAIALPPLPIETLSGEEVPEEPIERAASESDLPRRNHAMASRDFSTVRHAEAKGGKPPGETSGNESTSGLPLTKETKAIAKAESKAMERAAIANRHEVDLPVGEDRRAGRPLSSNDAIPAERAVPQALAIPRGAGGAIPLLPVPAVAAVSAGKSAVVMALPIPEGGAMNLAPLPTAVDATRKSRAEFAAVAATRGQGAEMFQSAGEKNFVSAEPESLTPRRKVSGTDVAKAAPTMSDRLSSLLPQIPAFEPGAVAALSVGGVTEAIDVPRTDRQMASETVSSAHDAVEVALHAAEQLASRDQKSVRLQFSVGDAQLDVHVEVHANEVRTTFRTESAELRQTLSQEWQAVTGTAGGDRGLRLAPAVFSANDQSAFNAFAGDTSSRQRDQRASRETADRATRGVGAVSRSHGASVGTHSVSSGPRLSAPFTSQHLHTLA